MNAASTSDSTDVVVVVTAAVVGGGSSGGASSPPHERVSVMTSAMATGAARAPTVGTVRRVVGMSDLPRSAVARAADYQPPAAPFRSLRVIRPAAGRRPAHPATR